jgi:outer membrane protein
MRRTPLFLSLLATALLVAASALPAAAGPGFDVGARGVYWFPSISGDVDTGDGKIDLESDLGLEDENFLGAEAFARVAWFGARAGFMPIKFDATNTLPGDITFEGVTFPSGTDVSTELDVKTADVEIDFAPRLTVPWLANAQLGLLVKGKFVDGTVTLSQGATKVEQDLKGVVPMVGVLAGAGVLKDRIRLDARVAGMAYGGHHLYEGDVCLSLVPFDLPVLDLALQGGYRFIDMDVEDGDLTANLTIAGPYAGVQLAF